jgi:predicted transcriptional regulator
MKVFVVKFSVREFLDWRQDQQESGLEVRSLITATQSSTLADVMNLMGSNRVHRVFVVDTKHRPTAVISLSDVLNALVVEPPNYFGDYFVLNEREYRS